MGRKYDIDYAEIAEHNARIQAEIDELEGKKKKYQAAIDAAKAIIASIESLITSCGDVNGLLENIIVGGEPVGHNAFAKDIRNRISGYKDTFEAIIGECEGKIGDIDIEINNLRSKMINI